MITDVYVVFNENSAIERLGDAVKVSPFFHYIDEETRDGKKEAFKLKSHWGARLTPFAVCFDGEKPVKAFYSEADNVIEDLIKYLNK